MKQIFKSEDMHNLVILSNVLGLRNDCKDDLKGSIELPTSKYRVTKQKNIRESQFLSIPLVAVPIILKKNESYKFSITTNSNLYGDISSLDSFRDYFLTNREKYWKQLTGESNPSSENIRSALLNIEDFLHFIN